MNDKGVFLILHGWGSSSEKWSQIKKNLEKEGYDVLIPDLPGFGNSLPPEKPWFIDDYVDWVYMYCKKMGLSSFFLAGHSFGGAVAARFTARHPAKIKKLFLISAAVFRKKSLFKRIVSKISRYFSFLPKRFKKFVYLRILKTDYPLDDSKKIMRETFKRIINADLTNYLKNIKKPTIIIWGDKDDITPIENAYNIKKIISDSVLEIIPGATHKIHLECPEKLSEILVKYSNDFDK
jgi:pimeloyl-ACP methyl ester carboxylesterase